MTCRRAVDWTSTKGDCALTVIDSSTAPITIVTFTGAVKLAGNSIAVRVTPVNPASENVTS
jgi:hypothetical protein